MSFKCSACSVPQPAGSIPVRRVSKLRDKLKAGKKQKRKTEEGVRYESEGGFEIVEEQFLCEDCDSRLEEVEPEVV